MQIKKGRFLSSGVDSINFRKLTKNNRKVKKGEEISSCEKAIERPRHKI